MVNDITNLIYKTTKQMTHFSPPIKEERGKEGRKNERKKELKEERRKKEKIKERKTR